MDPSSQQPELELAGLLGRLRVEVIDLYIWAVLDQASRANLRLVCRAARTLANELITSVGFDMSVITASGFVLHLEHATAHSPGVAPQSLMQAWRDSAEQRSAFLARLPRLKELSLWSWPSSEELERWLQSFSSSKHIISMLTLDGGPLKAPVGSAIALTQISLDCGPLNSAAASAVALCLPHLRRLKLGCRQQDLCRDQWVPITDASGLGGDVFLPFTRTPLRQLHLGHGCSWLSLNSTSSLVALSQLETLVVDVAPDFMLSQVQRFSSLVSLTDLELHTHLLPAQAAPLFSLTKLTRLHLDRILPMPADTPVSSNDVLAALGQMVHLQDLWLGHAFRLTDAALTALCQLPKLTSLFVGVMALSKPVRGHLSQLQKFGFATFLSPSSLHASLSLLLPFPHLQQFLSLGMTISTNDVYGAGANELEAAIKQAALLLATLPPASASQLTLHHDAVSFSEHLFVAQAARALQPLAQHLRHLSLSHIDMSDPDWRALGLALPHLQELHCDSCTLTNVGLVSAAACLVGLQRLELRDCTGYEDTMWCMFCAARSTPLMLSVQPEPAIETMAWCSGRSRSIYGSQGVSWEGFH